MALKDYHLSGENASATSLDASTPNTWEYQTFTPLSSYTATQIALKCFRNDSGATGTLTFGIYATSGGLPTGSALATGTLDVSTLDSITPGSFEIITLNAGVALIAGTRYAIVISGSISAGDFVFFRTSGTSNYAYGTRGYSINAGGSWTAYAGNTTDNLFKIYDNSTYISQVIFAAGNVSGGKHLWKIVDDGENLSTDSSYALGGNVTDMAYSSVTRRLYIAIGNIVYCYDADTITLVEEWGSSGSINIGAAVNGLAIDSSDYLAVAHAVVSSNKRVSLYDNTGSLLWQSTAFGTNTTGNKVSFNLDGNINACTLGGNAGTLLAGLLSRINGSLLTTYETRAVAAFNGDGIASSKDTNTYCFYTSSYASTALVLKNGVTTIWFKNISGAGTGDIVHINDLDLVFVSDAATLKGYYDVDGDTHPWADYTPINSTPLSANILGLISGLSGELYICDSGGFVGTCNPSVSCRSSVQASTTSLTSIVWAGNQNIAPVITDQSSDTTADEGDLVELFVTATGIPTPTYQWYKNDILIDGETNSTISFPSVNRTDAGTYKCIVTNVAGSVESSPIILTVYYSEITAQSSNSTFGIGQLMTLTVTAIGNPVPTYQWYKDEVIISGAVSSSYSKYVALSDAGTYKCKVSNAVGDIYTTDIVVLINTNPYVWGLNLNLDQSRLTEMATNYFLDQGWHLDMSELFVLEGEFELSVETAYVHAPFRDLELEINSEMEVDVVHSVALDLLPLIPEKFHSSEILQAYIKEVGFQIGGTLTLTRDIVKLLSPNTVNDTKYLRHLAALIGVKLPPEDESDVVEIRKILANAVEWYKVKGTYRSIELIALLQSFSINLYDMYTNDYVNFILTDWFVGEENENPTGLDATYYKSPHFGLEVILNQVYTEGSLRYLWYNTYLDNLAEQIEETRPVHTVPHFLILLNPKTDEKGNIIEVSGEIKTKVTSNWQFGIKYFDAVGSANAWSFDTGIFEFDTDETSFIKSINKWVLGTGNYPADLGSTATSVEVPVLTGTIDAADITIEDDFYSFEFIVPKNIVQYNISELGLYLPGAPDQLMILSAFPKINKSSDLEMRVVVEVYKEDLSI